MPFLNHDISLAGNNSALLKKVNYLTINRYLFSIIFALNGYA